MMEESARMSPSNAFAKTKLAAAKKSQKVMEETKDSRVMRKNCQV